MVEAEALAFQVVGRIDQLNGVAKHLARTDYGVYPKASISIPRLVPPELGFIRTVSWLYVHYHEVGKVGTAFLAERIGAFGLGVKQDVLQHAELIRRLRTYLQHNLDPTQESDRLTQEGCENWMAGRCGSPSPGTDTHWKNCLEALLLETVEFLDALTAVARAIEVDESREAICNQWVFKLERFYPPHVFDKLIAEVAADMGREFIDPIRVRQRFYDKWISEMALLGPEYDFDREARKRVENALLSSAILPITGQDIMEEFRMGPGPTVGKLLELAQRFYSASPCNRGVLLDRLRERLSVKDGDELSRSD